VKAMKERILTMTKKREMRGSNNLAQKLFRLPERR
jgi:hypothetical protein